jgi:hypothetical protein
MVDAGLGAPAIIGMIGGIVGLLGGVASFRDRFYKGRPIASLTTRNCSGRNIVLVRIKNTTEYDILMRGTAERRGIYYLTEDSTTINLIRGQLAKPAPPFILKPDETKELVVNAKYKDDVAVEALGARYVEFWIFWLRGNATWLPQIPIPVCTNTQTIRELGGVE